MITTTKELLEKICQTLEVDVNDIRAKKRLKELVRARFLYYYIGFQDFLFQKVPLGKELGSDHTCVIHGIKSIKAKIIKEDSVLIAQIRKVRADLNIEDKGYDTILERQYDSVLLEMLELKKQNKTLQAQLEDKDLEIKKLQRQCLSLLSQPLT